MFSSKNLVAGFCFIACTPLIVGVASAQDAEVIDYTYDVHGRLVKVVRSGSGVQSGGGAVTIDYEFDDAGNRTRRKVNGSAHNPPQ